MAPAAPALRLSTSPVPAPTRAQMRRRVMTHDDDDEGMVPSIPARRVRTRAHLCMHTHTHAHAPASGMRPPLTPPPRNSARTASLRPLPSFPTTRTEGPVRVCAPVCVSVRVHHGSARRQSNQAPPAKRSHHQKRRTPPVDPVILRQPFPAVRRHELQRVAVPRVQSRLGRWGGVVVCVCVCVWWGGSIVRGLASRATPSRSPCSANNRHLPAQSPASLTQGALKVAPA